MKKKKVDGSLKLMNPVKLLKLLKLAKLKRLLDLELVKLFNLANLVDLVNVVNLAKDIIFLHLLLNIKLEMLGLRLHGTTTSAE